ncbi:hypothetical protein UK15_29930 [Streptomyces variegatus]|uniref:Uncharacterized protein n=1 Tax=Streptomyces variegatus TaxID=284040 RepID=A0A0M2GKV3_9ACTN|nr:hypothetical protein UK15_29930 [Streptomyces variegatus]
MTPAARGTFGGGGRPMAAHAGAPSGRESLHPRETGGSRRPVVAVRTGGRSFSREGRTEGAHR